MCARRLTAGDRARIHLVLAGLFLSCASLSAKTQTAPEARAKAATLTRPCSANPVLPAPTEKKKSSRKPKHPLPPELPPTCVELKGEGIEIQEFLQNTAREESWRIGENHASEDTWSFVRYLGVDELEKYADTKVLLEPVKFTSGKAAVILRTTEIGDGYARVQISAHIQGEGKSTDKLWSQPASVWPLNSNGVLEQELVTALQMRYKPLE
jgi:hypothetical protein